MKRAEQRYQYYLHDLGKILKDRALDAKSARDLLANESTDYAFAAGRLIAFNEVISIMQQEADGFGIPLHDIRLNDIDPDRDLT